MNPSLSIARSELILGGQKSGKSRRAEALAREWLAQAPQHRALLIATGQAHDGEMRERIARHRRERAEQVPGLATLEEPRALADAIA
ncbi:MAG: bifunctional adenosylcobinamide kinase/adenosylcobinamide-phosphate guanylyltransferase, partial [Hydrogenophaga sp.]